MPTSALAPKLNNACNASPVACGCFTSPDRSSLVQWYSGVRPKLSLWLGCAPACSCPVYNARTAVRHGNHTQKKKTVSGEEGEGNGWIIQAHTHTHTHTHTHIEMCYMRRLDWWQHRLWAPQFVTTHHRSAYLDPVFEFGHVTCTNTANVRGSSGSKLLFVNQEVRTTALERRYETLGHHTGFGPSDKLGRAHLCARPTQVRRTGVDA